MIFDDVSSENEFVKKLKALNGNFAVIHTVGGKTFAAVDRIMSFPILYARKHNNVLISDSAETLRAYLDIHKVDLCRAQEFISAGFVTGNHTLFEGISMLQAGQYLVVEDATGEITVKDYFIHTHGEYYDLTTEKLCELHDQVVLRVFRRLINSINGGHITLFLSGGYDSRLIAVSLSRLKYQNVTCVSFGDPRSKEVRVAKSVADELGFAWVLIHSSRRFFESLSESDRYENFLIQSSNGYVIPYFQGVVIERLIQDGTIPKDTIVLSGNSGDVIEGNQFCTKFEEGNSYSRDDIIDSLIDKHYRVFGKRESQENMLRGFISECIPDRSCYSYEECQDIYECFNWRQRQAKYVVNDVRCYDSYWGTRWRLPLWDNELVDFWLRVPTQARAYRRLYYEYVKAEPYRTANTLSITHRISGMLKKRAMPLVEILYPVKKLWDYLVDRNTFYAVGIRDYLKILLMTKGYQTSHITTRVYFVLRHCYGKYFDSLDETFRSSRSKVANK